MTVNNIVRFIGAVMVVAGTMGGCKCGSDVGVDEAMIDEPPIAEEKPNADRPRVVFPHRCITDDPTLNDFVRTVLTACERGDYDKFRQLFGTAYNPTSKKDFERYWFNVQEIAVAGVHPSPDKKGPPEYYLHAVVRLREPDRQGRLTRPAVVVVFQELGEWRMVPASKEIAQKVITASTQPTTVPVFKSDTD